MDKLRVVMEMSGEVGEVCIVYGLQVGRSGLLRMFRLSNCWMRVSPLVSGWSTKYQTGWRALRSLRMKQKGLAVMQERSGEKPGGQD